MNFTKASEKLNLTQSAVSHQIKALEQELGVALFIRAKRGVILTDAGKVALEYAARILHEAEEMRAIVAGREKALVGRVRVAAATQALVFLFAPLFEEFMDAHESVELVFRTTVSTEQTVEDILEGVADIGFASLRFIRRFCRLLICLKMNSFWSSVKNTNLRKKRSFSRGIGKKKNGFYLNAARQFGGRPMIFSKNESRTRNCARIKRHIFY